MEGFMENILGNGKGIFSNIAIWGFLLKIFYSIIIFIISKLIIRIGQKFIDRFMKKEGEKNYRRKKTLILLLESILLYIIYFFAFVIILSIFGVPVASLIAGAGILGLAVGFGAQSLVEDVINGFFILFEDQYAVGDYVGIADKEGIVQELGLRTTTIRNFAGEIHIIPNGDIRQVTNYSVSKDMRVMVDVGISYDEKPAEAIAELKKLCQLIAEEKTDILTEGPVVLGVNELAGSSVVLRVLARVKPMEQWAMGRYIKQRIKEYFDEVGIEIAYPYLVLLSKADSVDTYSELSNTGQYSNTNES